MDAAQFRAIGPQFSDLTAFPPEAVDFWLGVAATRLYPSRWLDLLGEGTYLFVAHNLTLATAAAKFGALLGGAGGVVSSKSVGGVSVAYNTELGTIAGAGAYNLTVYGREFWQLAQIVGTTPMQL